METLIRAVAAAKDGRRYTVRDEKWHVRYQELKAFREMVRIMICRYCFFFTFTDSDLTDDRNIPRHYFVVAWAL